MQPPGMGYYFKFEVGFSFTSFTFLRFMCNACQLSGLSGLSATEGVYGGKRIFKFNFSSFIIHSNFKKRSKFIIEFMTA